MKYELPLRRTGLGRHLGPFIGLMVLASVLTSCGENLADQALGGTVRTPTPNVADIEFPNAGDQSDFVFRAVESDILVLYFGYTSCPDVCPTTMADLSAALELLGEDGDRVSVAMLTIDPDRDTNDVVSAYVDGFIPGGIGLRTLDDELLRSTARRFGANYSVVENEEGVIEVGHTGFLYAIDSQGDLEVSWAYGLPASEIHRDLEILLARTNS